jgi:hypothetical protein
MQSRGWIFVRIPLQPQALKERLAGFTLSKWLIVHSDYRVCPGQCRVPSGQSQGQLRGPCVDFPDNVLSDSA